MFWPEDRLPLATRSGRLPVPLVVEVCSVGVKGSPVCRVHEAVGLPAAENSVRHAAPIQSARPLPNGRCRCRLAVKRWRMSYAELPRSQLRQRGSCGVPVPPPNSVPVLSMA